MRLLIYMQIINADETNIQRPQQLEKPKTLNSYKNITISLPINQLSCRSLDACIKVKLSISQREFLFCYAK